MKTVYLFLAEGFEEMEAIGTVDVLRRGGIKADLVSITGNKTVTGSHGISMVADYLFEDIDFNQADALVLPGGLPGADNLNQHEGLKKKLTEFAQNNEKVVGAICAAPKVLGGLGLLKGKNAISYPGFEKFLEGATVAQSVGAVKDGNIITGKGPAYIFEFGLMLLEEFAGKEKREEVAKGMLYSVDN